MNACSYHPPSGTPPFLTGASEAAALMRELDVDRSPLGAPESWPQALRSVVALMLGSKFPMFVAWGPELGFLYNDAYAVILGAKHPAAMGARFQDIWHEIWADIGPLAERALAGEATWLEDLPLVMNRKGYDERTWFTFSYSPVRDDDGAIAGIFCACTETTEKLVAEQALRESEARLRFATEGARIGTWDWDMRTLRGSWSKRTQEILGVTNGQDITPEQRAATIHPDDRDRVWQDLGRAIQSGDELVSEYRVLRPDGGVRWVASRGAIERGSDGAAVRAAGVVVDITDQKAAEAVLRQSEAAAERERLWSLSQDMLARADYAGMMSAVSPAWKRVLGWDEAELLTRGYASFMHPDDAGSTLAAIERMGATGQPTRFENRIATRDGGWKPIEWTVAPEPDGRNFIAVGRDLSDAKAREAELQAAQEALRQSQKMEAMGQLTGGVAHDFNNLLTPITGTLDLLQRRGLGDERAQRQIAGALQSAERAKTLVQRLLAFARRQPLQPTGVDVGTVVAGIAELVGSTSGPKIRLALDVAPDAPPAYADANQLEMAILNLSVNARDAMPDGGRLSITVDNCPVAADHRSRLPAGEYIRLAVSDTGTGMDEETLARAVEPFFSTKGIGQGTGLGLSMVHGLALQLGGALTLQSRPGLGTTAELWLRPAPASAVPAAAVARPSGAVGSGTVLLVDDEELVRTSTADMLADLGFKVVEAPAAEEAMRLIADGLRPDLLVTDHLMPGMNGPELAAAARAERPGLPVLIVSGYAEHAGIDPALPRLAKPFRRDELAAALADMLAAVTPA